MNTQHTPGPWELRQSSRDYWFIDHEQSGEGYTLTKLECNEADARLIAAAPEMFELLYTVLPYIEDLELDQMYKPGVVAALTRRIRDTLDKAEGVQP